jgi:hypothetical protein
MIVRELLFADWKMNYLIDRDDVALSGGIWMAEVMSELIVGADDAREYSLIVAKEEESSGRSQGDEDGQRLPREVKHDV